MAQQEQSSGDRGWAECSTIIIGRPREEPTAAILVFGYYGVGEQGPDTVDPGLFGCQKELAAKDQLQK